MARQCEPLLISCPSNLLSPLVTHIKLLILSKFGNPELNGGGGWGIFNAVLGWQNTATYGSVISYNVYWIAVICGFLAMRYSEVYGHWPLVRPRMRHPMTPENRSSDGIDIDEKKGGVETLKAAGTIEV